MKAQPLTTDSIPLTQRVKRNTQDVDYETFKKNIKEWEKADLIEGEIIMQSPASYTHEKMFGFLYWIVKSYIMRKDLGKILGSRTLVKIDEKSGYEPDILFVSNDRLDIIKNMELVEAPDMAVEIISQSSRVHDRVNKFLGYQDAGVKEYWLIDAEQEIAEFYENRDGEFEQIDTKDGIFRSNVIKGFWLKIEWLFSDVDEFEVLEEILTNVRNDE
jgi:Uma2 family endonuclease